MPRIVAKPQANRLTTIRPPGAAGTMSLAEQIASQLAEMIVMGEYQPGDRVHEMAVSSQFEVSRGPVREALRLLENEGLVTILPRRGAVVTDLSTDEVRDIFEIRSVLFGLAARRVAEMNDPEMLVQLEERVNHLAMLSDAKDDGSDDYVAAVQELSLFVSSQSVSHHLTDMIYSLFRQTLRYSRLSLLSPKRRLESAANWRQLYLAVSDGDGVKAESVGKRLIDESKNEAMRRIEKPT